MPLELLNELARLRGQQFSYSGVRLPLPVSLHVRDMTFADVLRLTEAQTALAGNTLAVSRAFTSVFYDAGEKNENTPVSPAVCSPAYRLCRTASPFFCRHDRKRTAPRISVHG